LGYDLASLLLDPYAGLSEEEQQELFVLYLDELEKNIDIDREQFSRGYYYLALQRNLQILGAFAFLTQKRGKEFFRQYLVPASSSLVRLLCQEQGSPFPALLEVARQVQEKLTAGEEQ
jgi:aminoglycoside/choline kinase family phosphotransferase